jgi:hypothetical protein
MLIRITGHAEVTSDDGGGVPTGAALRALDGAESDDECSNYLDNDLADLGITGGKVRLLYDAGERAFRVVTEYTSPEKLSPTRLKRLARATAGQWSDEIGEGCFDELADRLGVTIDLAPLGARRAPDVEQVDDGKAVKKPSTALFRAAREGDLAALRKRLDAGDDVNARQRGSTPLHQAVISGHASAALELIARGADVHALDARGEDPLMLAALSNRITDAVAATVARALLERGANVHGPRGPDANPRYGEYTPLYMARNRKKTELAAVLKASGAGKPRKSGGPS